MTRQNCLQLEQFNGVIVGNGAIGSALLHNLLKREELHRVVVLGRSPRSIPEDPRITFLTFDAGSPESVFAAAAEVQRTLDRVHLLVNTVGLLHSENQLPEKHLKAVSSDHLQHSFQVNAALLPLLAQAFGKMLRHEAPAVFASLSARVGSIEDNRLGGWYSYRVSKAAHNMLLKSVAREWRVSHRNVTVAALHPGTVRSRLSEPFLTERYPHRILTPEQSANALLDVINTLCPKDSGCFLDWQGKPVPW